MIRLEAGLGILLLILAIFCLIDAIQTPDDDVRNLPKIVWVLLILLFPLAGGVAWLLAGRPGSGAPTRRTPPRSAYPEYDRPGRARAANPEDDEAFMRQVRARAEEQRRAYRERQLAEQRAEEERRRSRGETPQPPDEPGAATGSDPGEGPAGPSQK